MPYIEIPTAIYSWRVYKCLHLFGENIDTFYHYHSDDKNSNEYLNDILEYRSGNMFLTTAIGLVRSQKTKFNYKRLFGFYSHNELVHTLLDNSNKLWYLDSNTNFLCSYDILNNTKKQHKLKDEKLPAIAEKNRFQESIGGYIYEDSKKNLWLSVNSSLYLFNKNTSSVDFSIVIKDSSNTEAKNDIIRMYEDKSGKFWVFSFSGIYLYNESEHLLIKKPILTLMI